MTPRRLRKLLYLAVCIFVLFVWIWFGRFEAIEAPYLQF